MIGICIRYFHENYGGMLQAFATTKLLEKYGIDYEIIRYKKKKDFKFIIKSLPRIFNNVLLNDKYEALQKKLSFKEHPDIASNEKVRMQAFDNFRKKNFTKLSEEYYGFEGLQEGAKKYEAVITGSDQLWSPAGLPTNFYNLKFVPDNIRKISLASSFGVKYIPWYQKKRTKEFLNRIEYISMRENAGQKIVKELTGRDVPVVLDPVFMFNKEEWEELLPNKKEYEEEYIFAYFLGKNSEHRKVVKEFAKKKNLKIVTLRHLDQFVEEDEIFGDYAPYDVSPDKFLNLLRGAKYVCTDSFHGAVFSIIHKKDFLVFNRYSDTSKHSKNSRIDSLCQNLEIQNCRYNGDAENIFSESIDYSKIDENYKKLKAKTDAYIDKALEGIK